MLKMVVPTPENAADCAGGVLVALIANTSRSGSENLIALSQLRPSWSTQWVPLYFTMSPASGPLEPDVVELGAGRPPGYSGPMRIGTRHGPALEPPLHTTPSLTVAVRFPELN